MRIDAKIKIEIDHAVHIQEAIKVCSEEILTTEEMTIEVDEVIVMKEGVAEEMIVIGMVPEMEIEGLGIEVTHHRDAEEETGRGREIERDLEDKGPVTGVEGHQEIDRGGRETLGILQSQGIKRREDRDLTQKTKVNQRVGQSLGKNH